VTAMKPPSLIESKGTRATVALVWALVVGSLMSVGAYEFDLPAFAVVLAAVLGGIGSAVFVLAFLPAESAPGDSTSPGPDGPP
jgi:hypothetical protein